VKVIKTASGKQTIKISKSEWKSIGKKNGWTKEAQEHYYRSQYDGDNGVEGLSNINPRMNAESLSDIKMYLKGLLADTGLIPNVEKKIADAEKAIEERDLEYFRIIGVV